MNGCFIWPAVCKSYSLSLWCSKQFCVHVFQRKTLWRFIVKYWMTLSLVSTAISSHCVQHQAFQHQAKPNNTTKARRNVVHSLFIHVCVLCFVCISVHLTLSLCLIRLPFFVHSIRAVAVSVSLSNDFRRSVCVCQSASNFLTTWMNTHITHAHRSRSLSVSLILFRSLLRYCFALENCMLESHTATESHTCTIYWNLMK